MVIMGEPCCSWAAYSCSYACRHGNNPRHLRRASTLIAKSDALTHATAELFDDIVRVDDVEDRRSLERLAHLVSAAADAAADTVAAGDRLAVETIRDGRG